MPSLLDSLFSGAPSDVSKEMQIKMMLAQAGGQNGLPPAPFSGLPSIPKSSMFDPNFLASLQQQKVVGAPEPMLAPPPELMKKASISVGESLGMDDFNKGLRAAAGEKTDAKKSNLDRIMDALKASGNAMSRLYDGVTAADVKSSATPQKRVYNPMQAPDKGEEMPPEAALEQYRYNLGNIRTSGIDWQGKSSPYKGFESFVSPEAGARAMYKNLSSYAHAAPDMTLADAISKWAPASENDTKGYIAFVAKNAGLPPDAPLAVILSDPQKAAAMMYWMGKMEHGGNLPTVFTPEFLAKVALASKG